MTEETADAWVAAWDARGGLERGPDYWQAAWDCIAAQAADAH